MAFTVRLSLLLVLLIASVASGGQALGAEARHERSPHHGHARRGVFQPSSRRSLTRPVGPFDVVTPFPTGRPLFAPNSVWNAPLAANARLDPRSNQLSRALAAEVGREAVGHTGPWINTNKYSVSVYTVGAEVRAVHVALDVAVSGLQHDFDSVPIPANAHPAAGGDGTLVIYQPSTDTLWEFWLARLEADGWHARWGGEMDHVSTNPGYFPGSYGASGTSLALLGGLMTIHELESQQIHHALALGIPNTAAGAPTWPAQRSDGTTKGSGAIPEGTHFRIDPSLDLSKLHLSPLALAMARAVQRYGMVVRDTSGCVAFYAEDPTTSPGDPYARVFGGQYPNDLLQGFPWKDLQVVAPSAS